MQKTYWINVRDKPAFLVSVMKELAGSDSQILFEGDLTKCDFSGIGKSELTGELFVCNKGAPFVVLPLSNENIKPILNQVLPYGRVVHKIEHIQIQKNGAIQLMVGDNFHNECISVGPEVSLELLSSLKGSGIVRRMQTESEVRAKYRR